jgi:hypothetical protein
VTLLQVKALTAEDGGQRATVVLAMRRGFAYGDRALWRPRTSLSKVSDGADAQPASTNKCYLPVILEHAHDAQRLENAAQAPSL